METERDNIKEIIQKCVSPIRVSSAHFPKGEDRVNYLLIQEITTGSVDYFPNEKRFVVNPYEESIINGENLQAMLNKKLQEL